MDILKTEKMKTLIFLIAFALSILGCNKKTPEPITQTVAPDTIWGRTLTIGNVWLDVRFTCDCGQYIIAQGTASVGDTATIHCLKCGEVYTWAPYTSKKPKE